MSKILVFVNLNGKQTLVDSFATLTDAQTYADMMNRRCGRHIYLVSAAESGGW
jgi:hypothetical protein